MSYVRPATMDTGNLIGRAQTEHAGRATGISSIHVEDRHGRLMAHGTTRCVITSMPFDPDGEVIAATEPILDPPDPYLRETSIPTNDFTSLAETKPRQIMQQFVDGAVHFGPNAQLMGTRPRSVGDGLCEMDMPASPWFSAGMPTMYGGVIAWALDNCLTGAIYSSLDAGAFMASLDLKVRFLRPAFLDGSRLTLHGEVVHRGRTLRTARAELSDANGKRIALATGSAMVLPDAVAQLASGRAPDEIVPR